MTTKQQHIALYITGIPTLMVYFNIYLEWMRWKI
ncbi:hypothetical protein VPHPS15B6_0050 [Vibrio phage PS15B-6]